jgi:hypothetical protein
MVKYEYKVLEFENISNGRISVDTEKRLNAFGAQGWKVVGTGGAGEMVVWGWVILMREVQ